MDQHASLALHSRQRCMLPARANMLKRPGSHASCRSKEGATLHHRTRLRTYEVSHAVRDDLLVQPVQPQGCMLGVQRILWPYLHPSTGSTTKERGFLELSPGPLRRCHASCRHPHDGLVVPGRELCCVMPKPGGSVMCDASGRDVMGLNASCRIRSPALQPADVRF